jgi:uncharacterized protein
MIYIEDLKNIRFFDNGEVDFIDAAAQGDIDSVRRFLDNGINPDTQGLKGWTALRMAAVKDKFDIARELLEKGARVDASNYTGQTALMMACFYGHYDMVLLLLSYGANPNLANCGGRTPLMIATSEGHAAIIEVLLELKPKIDVNVTDRNGKTALDMAFDYGHENVAYLLLSEGAVRTGKSVGQHEKEEVYTG